MTFTLPKLSYEYDALAPHIDAQTMEIHHSKHHQWYISKLNAAVEDTQYADMSLDELLQDIKNLPDDIRSAVQNNGWWHRNHSLFWKTMTPWGKAMSETFKTMIEDNFWSVDEFKDSFLAAAGSNFWSWWTRLVADWDTLSIVSTSNQNNPLMDGSQAILWVDVREHAYYLHYQNRRPDYLSARRKVIDREQVEKNI